MFLSSNLPISKWEQIFKDPITTVAAIDRLVHRSIILELNVPSIRLEHATRTETRHPRFILINRETFRPGKSNCRRTHTKRCF
ncbi:MAG: ATP-binding protein [Pirellula sp.]